MDNYSWTVNAVVKAIGEERAMLLLSAHGGGEVSVSRLGLSDSEVAALRGAFGSSAFRLPKADQILRARRNRRIHADRNAGTTIREIARKYGITDSQVYNILKISNF